MESRRRIKGFDVVEENILAQSNNSRGYLAVPFDAWEPNPCPAVE